MKVSRHGTARFQSVSTIEFAKPIFSWDHENSCVTIKQSRVRDFSTDSRHNYTACLSLVEVQSLLLAISDAAIADPTTFEKGLEPSLKPLLRLQAVIAGTVG